MKKITIILVLLAVSHFIFAQQEPDRSYYLHKSRQQKTLGTVTLIGGGAVALVGGYLWFMSPLAGLAEGGNIDGARHTGQTLVGIGGGMMALSIPLFIASDKNKKKADVYIGTSQVTNLPQGTVRQLSVGLKIGL